MLPQDPFFINCDCFSCKDNRPHDCEFLSWKPDKHEVHTLCTCTECEAQLEVIMSVEDYEYLQSELPNPHLN